MRPILDIFQPFWAQKVPTQVFLSLHDASTTYVFSLEQPIFWSILSMIVEKYHFNNSLWSSWICAFWPHNEYKDPLPHSMSESFSFGAIISFLKGFNLWVGVLRRRNNVNLEGGLLYELKICNVLFLLLRSIKRPIHWSRAQRHSPHWTNSVITCLFSSSFLSCWVSYILFHI